MNALPDLNKDSAKRDRRQLEQELLRAGAENTGRSSLRCPFHDDANPSASIKQASSGFWYFHCFVCGISDDVWALRARISGKDVGDILKETNQQISERLKERPISRPKDSYATIDDLIAAYRRRNPNNIIEEVNPYTDPETKEADFGTIRYLEPGAAKKKFLQISKTPEGWRYMAPKGKLPLFNRSRIKTVDKVLVVEGEKCVRFVTMLGVPGIAATTAPGGSLAAGKADWRPLAGKTCYIWRDNDDNGKRYENDVISILQKLEPPCTIYRVRVEELGLDPKGDVVNYLSDESITNAEKVGSFQLVLADAEQLNVTSALADKFSKITSGQFRHIPFPQLPRTSENSKAIMPGCIVSICGDPGSGKSFFVIENGWRWIIQKGERVKLLMLEDDPALHQSRALAQMSGRPEVLDSDYIQENAAEVQTIFAQYREHLETFARHVETADSQMTLTDIARWVIAHAENGVRIIIVDPITAAKASEKPWIDDQAFLFAVKPVLERTGSSLILTTHPRMGQAGKPSLSGMAGGAAYPRFSQCVIWLKSLDAEQESKVWDGYMSPTVKHKQILQIRKARNGEGQGKHIAVNLNYQNLCFDELGIIEKP